MAAGDITELLQRAVARHLGAPGTILDLQRLTGGANKTTWSFDAEIADRRGELIVQLGTETVDPVADLTPYVTPEDDARLMIAAVKSGVPAPKVRAILEPSDGLGHGYITERVAGETLGTRILRDELFAAVRTQMAAQCGAILAAIHRIEITAVPFLMRQDAAAQVDAHRRIIDHFGLRLPALELALKWAADNVPARARHTVVHGDFRLGNFIVGADGIRCVLDWELAQTGDPMQDLGWLCVKTWRFGGRAPVGGFGSREELFAAYERASGWPVDPAHVRFWEAFGNVKWAVDCLRLAARGIEENGIERCAIGRRIEEPLWDFLNLVEQRE
ncbi:MAG TPA: phosphotransferase family protein [Candidatus Binataceae bacterium]|nr:phosphotransferase family protein [Candidatus Binataceae bacterium]